MNRRTLILLLLLLVAALAVAIFYCVRRGGGEAEAAPDGPSAAMVGAMHRMHQQVDRTRMTGDVDDDFVALMVPHHQSAVDMARIYLKSGRDPELRRLAETIVATQETEIRQMRRRGGEVAAAPPHGGH
jgi:uncharacterized protein (DUF305 family)